MNTDVTSGNGVGSAGSVVVVGAFGEIVGADVGMVFDVAEVTAAAGGAVEGDSVMEESVPDVFHASQEQVPAKTHVKKINSTRANLLFALFIFRRHSSDFETDFITYIVGRKNRGRTSERQQVA